MKDSSICQYRDWDSGFFGYRIAEISVNHLTPKNIDTIMRWCGEQNIDCLYFFAEADDVETVRIAESNQFSFVDIRLTLEKQLRRASMQEHESPNSIIRLSASGDISSLKAIAGKSHYDSRFYYDPNFPKARCDALYETWIEKSCQGYADAVIVAEIKEQAVAYISCHLLEQGIGKMGLLGVSADAQGKGLGTSLMHASLQWFVDQEIRQVIVITQGRNINAQRLYQKWGFRTQSVQLVYHRWFK